MRTEHDSLGECEIPDDALYGIHTLRAYNNFRISGVPVSDFPELVRALAMVKKFALIALKILSMEESDVIIAMLSLIDAALVAGLIVMVMISGYENFVSRFDDETELTWLGKIGASSLKVKIASAIVAISSIHLLQVFLNATSYSNDKIMWSTLVHLTFVASAFVLALLDRIQQPPKSDSDDEAPKHTQPVVKS